MKPFHAPIFIPMFFIQCHWTPNQENVTQNTSPVVINELMSNNKTTIYDEKHEADDWIELYNTGKTSVSLKGLFLSNDSTNLNKFALPDTVMPSHGFIVIWADKEEKQGILHASFKLSKNDTENVFLTQGDNIIIDRVQLLPSALKSDESFGRWSDGAETWVKQKLPTPGSANSGGK